MTPSTIIMDHFSITVIFARIIVHYIMGIVLLGKWFKTERRYLTDFPLWISFIFLAWGTSKIVDLLIVISVGPSNDPNTLFGLIKLRYSLFALSLSLILVIVLIVWFRNKKKLQISLLAMYSFLWALCLIFINDYDSISKISAYLLAPVILLMIFTFSFVYHQKRLPDINSLYVVISLVVYTISQLLRPIMVGIGESDWGLMWLNEMIEIIAWFGIFMAFFVKPNYATIKKEELAISESS